MFFCRFQWVGGGSSIAKWSWPPLWLILLDWCLCKIYCYYWRSPRLAGSQSSLRAPWGFTTKSGGARGLEWNSGTMSAFTPYCWVTFRLLRWRSFDCSLFLHLKDRCTDIVGTHLSYFGVLGENFLSYFINKTAWRSLIVFFESFMRNISQVLVVLFSVKGLPTWFLLGHRIFFVYTVHSWFVFYVTVHFLFGQYVQILSRWAVVKINLRELDSTFGPFRGLTVSSVCFWIRYSDLCQQCACADNSLGWPCRLYES